MSLIGKTAVVTGGSSGIGLETARHLLFEGIRKLAIFDVAYNQEVVDNLQCDFPKSNVLFWKTDISDRSEVESSFKEIQLRYGAIDILINCAGVLDEGDVQKSFSINVLGTINCTQTAIEFMSIEKGGKGGIIANVASVYGLDPCFAHPIYNATKFAIIGLTRSFGDPFYYNIYGIKFVSICPGITDTPFNVDIGERFYRADAKELYLSMEETSLRQTAQECAKLLVDTLNNADNGSVWIIDGGKTKEATF